MDKDSFWLSVDSVVALLALDWKIADKSSCLKYIRKVAYQSFSKSVTHLSIKDNLDWDDF